MMYKLNIEILEKLRKSKFLSVDRLCKEIGINSSTYNKIKVKWFCWAKVAWILVWFFGDEILLDK